VVITIPAASDDVVRFFVAYSRFEFALKETSVFLTHDHDGTARPNWRAFSKHDALKDILVTLSDDPDVADLVSKPPMTQCTNGTNLDWRSDIEAPIRSVHNLLRATKTVRDNLFHGGKSGEDPRTDTLCRAALRVLMACLERHHDVRMAFEGKY